GGRGRSARPSRLQSWRADAHRSPPLRNREASSHQSIQILYSSAALTFNGILANPSVRNGSVAAQFWRATLPHRTASSGHNSTANLCNKLRFAFRRVLLIWAPALTVSVLRCVFTTTWS